MTDLTSAVLGACLVLGLAAASPFVPSPGRRPSDTAARAPTRPPRWLLRTMATLGHPDDAVVVWSVGRPVAATVIIGVWAALGPMAVLLLAGLLGAAPRVLRGTLRRRRSEQRDALLAAVLERLASALRAGEAPGPAFAAVASSTPEPLGSELRSVADEVRHGAGLTESLDRWALTADASPAVVLSATALALGVSTGGQLARSADRVAATIREHRELQVEARGLATQARSSATVLASAPVGFAAVVASVEPAMVSFLVSTPAGLACLVGGLALEVLGAVWMTRIVAGAT